jgi:hypothetical protein
MPSLLGIDDNVPPKCYGVYGRSDNEEGVGVIGSSRSGGGVEGESSTGPGVYGFSKRGQGVIGKSNEFHGVYGYSGASYGVYGESNSYPGVAGRSNTSYGVVGESDSSYGVYGESNSYPGVAGRSNTSYGVYGYSDSSEGVVGYSNTGPGVVGGSSNANGVYGYSDNAEGVVGRSSNANGVAGFSYKGTGVYGFSYIGLAALLEGDVTITGDVTMTGPVTMTGSLTKPGGSFRIDHPLDPANKYLSHSFVESPDMKNVYDGLVTLDDKGEAEIELPDWFGALNKDFRYQLTAIGAPGPNLHIAEEISDDAATTSNYNANKSRFKIAGGISGMKVSWQVTGIRKDPWANAYRIPVEEDKPAKERGYYYTYPELFMVSSQKRERDNKSLAFSYRRRKERTAHL